MLFRLFSGVMAALFAVSVLVQYNDPDRAQWMALYGSACVVSIIVAVRGIAPPIVSIAIGVIALVWAVFWASTSHAAPAVFIQMFEAWEMKSAPVEEARETTGLLLVAAWMAAVTFRTRFSRNRRPERGASL